MSQETNNRRSSGGLPSAWWFVILAIVCAQSSCNTSRQPDTVVAEKVFGGKSNLEIVQKAEKVETIRLVTDIDRLPEHEKALADYPTVGVPKKVPAEIAARVAATLAAPGSYVWDSPKGCVPIYGVRMSFVRGEDRIDILFCFECDILLVLCNNRLVGSGSFDLAHDSLLKEIKVLFPDDPAIQELRLSSG